jgi:hypothetical protein
MTALQGAHHEDDTTIDGGTVGHSFRFLKGILGREDTNWQQSASASDHNEYEGDTTQTATTTISYLCGHCHGVFHDQLVSGPSWVRHPTDTDVISQGGEYASYNDAVGGNAYSIEDPVAYLAADGIPGAPRSTVTTGKSIVMCLSCHRAHASPNDDILRWSYSTMEAGGSSATGTGCFRCHTTKDIP